jgi:ATP synthase in type III secretion protein N
VDATVTEVRIGEICRLVDPHTERAVLAEVIGLMDDLALLTPIGDIGGLSSLSEVVPTGEVQRVRMERP